jgi:SOS response regulatory protein OraA/RecX
MKILDLSLSQNLVKNQNSPLWRGGSEADGVVAVENSAKNTDTATAATNGVRRMFGNKNEKGEKPEKERDLKNCRGYIIKILGLKDYSVRELQNKALKLNYKIEDIQLVLDQLIKDNWINDQRLAENLIECYDGRKGKMWLQQKLNMRLIDKEIITKTLSELEILPSQSLKKQVEVKYKVQFGQFIEPKVKQKIAAFLAGRGFGNVFGVIKQWESGE